MGDKIIGIYSNMTDVWGPPLWKEIHLKSLTSSTDEFRVFLDSLPDRIPCEKCRRHYNAYRAEHPIHKNTNVLMWGIRFHNSVNLRLGKPVIPPPKAIEMIKRWEKIHRISKMGQTVLSMSLIVVALMYIKRNRRI